MLSFPPSPSVKIFVARAPADMRKGVDGLAGEVIDVIDGDPQSGHLLVFLNKRRDRLKCLLGDPATWMSHERLPAAPVAAGTLIGAAARRAAGA